MDDRALADVTVLDFSQGVAGPLAGAFFADLGADVVSVEPPDGKTARHYSSGETIPNIARNKRSMVLDLKAEGSDEVLHGLVEGADVLLHNNRPGVSEELGMGTRRWPRPIRRWSTVRSRATASRAPTGTGRPSTRWHRRCRG